MKHFLRALCVTGLLSLVAAGPCCGADKADFLGRWDITIANTGDTFRASWWEITETDGKLDAKLLWRWGSVTGVKSVEVEGDEIRVTRGESYEDKPVDVVYAAKLVGGKLLGSVKNPDGSTFQFIGIRAIEKTDVSGTWQVAFQPPRGTRTGPTFTLTQEGSSVTGKYLGFGNREFPIQNGKLNDAKLTFSVDRTGAGRGPSTIHYSAEVSGDRMTGTSEPQGGQAAFKFTAERQRKWGEPIRLFDGNDLAGLKPRDPTRSFNWSVKDGVLVNRPPDQDIVTEKQFQDFKLHVELNLARGSNSGIYLRGRYELQLLDDYGRQPNVHSNCSIYSRLAPSVNASRKADEWQTVDAILVGRWLTVVLNGETVMDNIHLDGITGGALIVSEGGKPSLLDETKPGPLMFQGDHGLVRFRKMEVTPAVD